MPDKFKATVWICKGTGISHHHVKYLNGDGAAKAFFTGKSIVQWQTSAIRGFVSMYSKNVSKIHVPGTLADYCECDFICYENNGEGIFWVNKIESLENVNENTVRIYYTPDYWHTWIEKVKFGQCLVERRHLDDMSDPYLSFTDEPISVPTAQYVYDMDTLTDRLYEMMTSAKICLFMTSDEYNNANNSQVTFNFISGAPFWGKMLTFDLEDVTGVSNKIKSYLNNGGYTQSSQLPMITNIQRIKIIPEEMLKASGEVITAGISGFSEEGTQILPVPAAPFGKIYSPQFFRGAVICTGNGQTAPIDITKIELANGQANIKYTIEGCGGPYAKMRASFHQTSLVLNKTENQHTLAVDCPELPEIPISAFLAPRETTWGAIASDIGGAMSGVSSGAQIGRAAGLSGMASGVAAGAGALVGWFQGADQSTNRPASNYIISGSSPELAVALDLYEYKISMVYPTPDGHRQLVDFFNSYGYKIMQREVLTLKHGSNFTFIKLAEPATQTTPNIPHVAFREISSLLMEGVTIWVADIGSVKEYT